MVATVDGESTDQSKYYEELEVGGENEQRTAEPSASNPGRGDNPERASEALDQNIESLGSDPNLTPVLADAIGMTNEYDKRRKASEENIKRQYFKDDEKGFRLWKSDLTKVERDIKLRESIRQYEESQTRQFVKEQHKRNQQKASDAARVGFVTANNAALSGLAERRHTVQTEYEAGFNSAKKAYEEFVALKKKEREALVKRIGEIDRGTDEGLSEASHAEGELQLLDKEIEKKTAEYAAAFGAIQKKKDDGLASAKSEYDASIEKNRNSLKGWFRQALRDETQFQMKCGYDEETAFNVATSAVGENSKRTLMALIDAGQGDFVQTILDEIGADGAGVIKVPRKDATGNVVKDKDGNELYDWEWDPRGRLCMGVDDVAQVQKYLDAKLDSDIRVRRLFEQQQERKMDVEASRICVMADELSMAAELDLDAMRGLMEAAKRLQDAGYDKAHQVSSHLAAIVRSAERKSSKLQRDAAKLDTEQAFRDELQKFEKDAETAAALAFYLPDDEDSRIAVARSVDGQNRMIVLIENGISRGILKKAIWAEKLTELKTKRATEDKNAARNTLRDCGVEVDVAKTRELISNGSKASAAVAETLEEFGATVEGVEDEREPRSVRVRNAKALVYKWTDPDTRREYILTGDQYNALATVISHWQERHVNPSPTGVAVPKELRDFTLGVLRKSTTKDVVPGVLWWSDKEVFALRDITRVGENAIARYFMPTTIDESGRKIYNRAERYNRDIDAIRSATWDREMPSTAELRQAVIERVSGVSR